MLPLAPEPAALPAEVRRDREGRAPSPDPPDGHGRPDSAATRSPLSSFNGEPFNGCRLPVCFYVHTAPLPANGGWGNPPANLLRGLHAKPNPGKRKPPRKRFPGYSSPTPRQIARYLRAPFPSVTIPELTPRFQGHKLAIRERVLLRSFPRGCGLALIGN